MYILNALVPFNLIIDTDMGIIKLLRFEYRNNKYFYAGIVDGTDECLQWALMNREDPNPLSIAYKYADTDHDTMDRYYDQFIEQEYRNIIDLSCGTALASMTKISSYNRDQILRVTVLCSSELEQQTIQHRQISPFKTIISTEKDVDLGQYNCLYVKNVTDLDKYNDVSGLNIYIPCYGFNIIRDHNTPELGIPIDTVTKYASDNEINLFTLYPIDQKNIPIG